MHPSRTDFLTGFISSNVSLHRNQPRAYRQIKEEKDRKELNRRLDALWALPQDHRDPPTVSPDAAFATARPPDTSDEGTSPTGAEPNEDDDFEVSAPDDFFASLPPPANVKVSVPPRPRDGLCATHLRLGSHMKS